MSRAYVKAVCWFCGQQHSGNGLATISHMRKHVRAGELREVRSYAGRVKGYPIFGSRFERNDKKAKEVA